MSKTPSRPRAKSEPRIRALIGSVGVDAGMIYIGDPCYVIDKPLGRMAWGDFLDKLWGGPGRSPNDTHWMIDRGTAVVTTTGYGDGEYPVFAEFKDGRIARVIIDFQI